MNKILAVIRREFIARVRTKAFVISTLLLPVMIVAVIGVQIVMMSGSDKTTRIALVDGSSQALGTRISAALNAESFGQGEQAPARYKVKVFPADGNVETVRDRLIGSVGHSEKHGDDQFNGVLVLHADTLVSGKVNYYGDSVGSLSTMQRLQSSLTRELATVRLSDSGIDPQLVSKSMRSADLETTKISDGKITGQSGVASFMIAYVMGFILYLAIIIYGQQTMTSVIEEKTSRIMEVLASSLTPFQMLLGKVLGVGAAGLAQMAIWGGSVFLITTQRANLASLLGVSADAMNSFPIPTMSGALLVIFLLYFVLGFLLYGALYAAIGSMCNTIQETQQYATVVTMVILVGFFAVFSLINDPTGKLGVILSFVPFFSPFTMPVRWSLVSVPWPQLALSIALTVAALLACVWFAARIYRTGILMYGKKPGVKELWRWLRAG